MYHAHHYPTKTIELKMSNDDSLFNIVRNVINNSILREMPSMNQNKEIIAANKIIYKL